jgi:murein L,D-transpeptidase YcbB/YkuD
LSGEAAQALLVDGTKIQARAALRRFYAEREYRPAWSGDSAWLQLNELLGAIEQMSAHGLNPGDYHRESLHQAIAGENAVAIELLANDAYLTMAAHLLGGRLNPSTIEPSWTANPRELDLVGHLESALGERRIGANLDQLKPNSRDYAVLMEALALYRQAEGDGGWEVIAPGPAMKLGDVGPRVLALRKRLAATGLLALEHASWDRFNLELETAVGAFQRRIGIEADGVAGPVTLRELNKGPAARVAQIRANLERWRWLPEDLGSRHIRVNIADFRLEARRTGEIERIHAVIVGRNYRKTPVFSDTIEHVVLNPWWDTPDRLARLDKLPDFKKDPTLISRLGFQVLNRSGKALDARTIRWADYNSGNFPFRLRQRPGPQNALGRVKLMFPNKHNVYLHDTPSQELFARSGRAFSSGCVRVEDALGLTEWVLQETPGWSRAEIDALLATGRETRVDLDTKVPIHILYFTAVADPDGGLRLLNDLYDRDVRLVAALDLAAPGHRR